VKSNSQYIYPENATNRLPNMKKRRRNNIDVSINKIASPSPKSTDANVLEFATVMTTVVRSEIVNYSEKLSLGHENTDLMFNEVALALESLIL
jgi:hypothetical protein